MTVKTELAGMSNRRLDMAGDRHFAAFKRRVWFVEELRGSSCLLPDEMDSTATQQPFLQKRKTR